MGVRRHNCKGITKGGGAPPLNSVECGLLQGLPVVIEPQYSTLVQAGGVQPMRAERRRDEDQLDKREHRENARLLGCREWDQATIAGEQGPQDVEPGGPVRLV